MARRRADGRPQLFPLAAFLPPPGHIACCVHRNLADSRTWHIWYLVHLVLGTSTHKMMEIYLLCYLLCLCFLQEKFPPSVSKNVIFSFIEPARCVIVQLPQRTASVKALGGAYFYISWPATVLLMHVTDDCQNIVHFNQLTRTPCVKIHWTMYIVPDSYLVHLADPR